MTGPHLTPEPFARLILDSAPRPWEMLEAPTRIVDAENRLLVQADLEHAQVLSDDDAALIVAAVNALPALLAERAAHNLTRTALAGMLEVLDELHPYEPIAGRGIARAVLAAPTEMLNRAERAEAALERETAALNLTRTSLEASTADLAVLARALRGVVLVAGTVDAAEAAQIADARVVANQIVLGLAVAEADKPHHGNER